MKTRAEANGATVRSVERACDILGTFRREDEVLRLRELATRVSLDESTVLPLLKTLIGRNFIERVPPHHYRSHIKLNSTRQITVGYAAQSTEFAFSHEVTEGAIRAAEANGVRLIVTDNRYSKTAALKMPSR